MIAVPTIPFGIDDTAMTGRYVDATIVATSVCKAGSAGRSRSRLTSFGKRLLRRSPPSISKQRPEMSSFCRINSTVCAISSG